MKKILIISLLIIFGKTGYSQLNPMGSVYYQNQYMVNPAMAGTVKNWELNVAYKAQWNAIKGAPAMQSVTLTHGSENEKVGLGLNFFNDVAGVVQRTNIKATYAYHIKLNSNASFLDFGLSAGILNEWIDFDKVRGDMTDGSLYNFNQRKLYFDGDFGVAYRDDQLTVQGVMPNLKRFFNRDLERNVADRALFMAAVSYKFWNDGALQSIEPKVSFRGIENYKNIMDLGVNMEFFGDKLLLSGMYHTTNSVTVGAGTTYKGKFSILTQYTTNTSDIQNYSNGEAEIAIRYRF